MSKINKKTLAITGIVVGFIVIMLGAFFIVTAIQNQNADFGDKTIVALVIHGDKSEKSFTINTDSENLRGALEQDDLVQGEDGAYGLFVKTVDGETADDTKNEFWSFSKDGQDLMTGVDDTLIADGETYEIELSTWS